MHRISILDQHFLLCVVFKIFVCIFCEFSFKICICFRTHTVIFVDYKWKVDFHEWSIEEPIKDFDNANWTHQHKEFYINNHDCSKY